MATISALSMRDTARDCTIRIKVIHVKRTRFRLWLFAMILKLAALVSPTDVEIETQQ